jgi:hypothetical protein
MFEPDIADVQQPVINQSQFRVFNRRLHAAAAVVAANDDVLDFQNVNGILNHRKAVEIGVNHQVGDITVNKQFSWLKAGQTFRRHAAVGTSNPEKARVLRLCEFSKNPGSSSTSIFDHSALLLMSVSMSFMEVSDL